MIIEFVRECISFCRVKKIPNQFQDYLFKREYTRDWSKEMIIADRELHGLIDSWLSGSAKSFTLNRLESQSGHLVYKDLVEKFLARSPQKKQQISIELNSLHYQDENVKALKTESVPQFFTRARTLQFKFKCIGGECSEMSLVQHCAAGLMAHHKLYNHVSQIMDATPNADTFYMETMLLNKITLNNTIQKKKVASAYIAQAAREANMVAPRSNNAWEQPQRNPRDRTGLGSNKLVRFTDNNTPPKKPWFAFRGKNAQEQREALKRDYHANLAQIDAHEQHAASSHHDAHTDANSRGASGNTSHDTTTTTDGMAAMLAAIDQDTQGEQPHEDPFAPFVGMMIAERPTTQEEGAAVDGNSTQAEKAARLDQLDRISRQLDSELAGIATTKATVTAQLAQHDAHASATHAHMATLDARSAEIDTRLRQLAAVVDAPSLYAPSALLTASQPHMLTVDSGATDHIFNTLSAFDPDTVVECAIPITTAGANKIMAEAKGDVTTTITLPSGLPKNHTFKGCLFVPGAQRNLISTAKLTQDEGCKITLHADGGELTLPTGQRVKLHTNGSLLAIPTADRANIKLRASSWRNCRENDVNTTAGDQGGIGYSDGDTVYVETAAPISLQLPHMDEVRDEVRNIARALADRDTGTKRPALDTSQRKRERDARTAYAGCTPKHNNRAADFALSPPASQGIKRDASGSELFEDSGSSSDSDSGLEGDADHGVDSDSDLFTDSGEDDDSSAKAVMSAVRTQPNKKHKMCY